MEKTDETLAPTTIESIDAQNIVFGIPFVKINAVKRTVSGFATADNVDKTGDIVDFNASREAFQSWLGNIREMHGPKAVGKAISVTEATKEIDGTTYNGMYVKVYISKGAEDTWQKILDGTLQGFSIGGKVLEKRPELIKSNDKYSRRQVNRITKYILGELSVVDNPANPMSMYDNVSKGMLVKFEDNELRATDILDIDERHVLYCRNCDIAKVDYDSVSNCVSCEKQMMDVAITFEMPSEDFIKTSIMAKLQEEPKTEAGKSDKGDVHYRPGVGESCAGCIYFEKNLGSCTKVAGDISPNYVCDIYEDTEATTPTPIEVYANVTEKMEKVTFSKNDSGEIVMDTNLLQNTEDDNSIIKYLYEKLREDILSKVETAGAETETAQGGDFEKVDAQGLKSIRDILKSAFENVEEVLNKFNVTTLNSENSSDVSVTDQISLPAAASAGTGPGEVGTDGVGATQGTDSPPDSNVLPHMGKAEESEDVKVEETTPVVEAVAKTEETAPIADEAPKDFSEELEKFTGKVVDALDSITKNIETVAGRVDAMENSGASRKSGEVVEDLSKNLKDESFWGGKFFE